MDSKSLISVGIPVYNCEKYIERCVNSAINQDYTNVEIILVDDKSTDNSLHIIQLLQQSHPNLIRIIHSEKNQGPSVARNTIIDNANGKYLFFLDSDDEITSNCLAKLYDKSQEYNATITVAQSSAINTFNNTTYPIFNFKKGLEYINNNDEILENFCNGAWGITVWNKLFDLDFLKKNKLYFLPGIYSQDELWTFDIIQKLDSIAFLDEITYLYYLHGESIVFNKTKVNFENHQTIIEHFSNTYHTEKNSKRKKLILNHIIKFKELTLAMQWKSMKEDAEYWKQNYKRLQKAPSLSFLDYFSKFFSTNIKKKDVFQNLPVSLGYKLFKWRFERK